MGPYRPNVYNMVAMAKTYIMSCKQVDDKTAATSLLVQMPRLPCLFLSVLIQCTCHWSPEYYIQFNERKFPLNYSGDYRCCPNMGMSWLVLQSRESLCTHSPIQQQRQLNHSDCDLVMSPHIKLSGSSVIRDKQWLSILTLECCKTNRHACPHHSQQSQIYDCCPITPGLAITLVL